MQQRQKRRLAVEIARVPEKVVIPEAGSGKSCAPSQTGIVAREQKEPTREERQAHHHQHRRQDPTHASAVKLGERHAVACGDQIARNQVAGNDEEDVDADEPSGKAGHIEMEEYDNDYRDCTQTIDIRAIVELHNCPRAYLPARPNLIAPQKSITDFGMACGNCPNRRMRRKVTEPRQKCVAVLR